MSWTHVNFNPPLANGTQRYHSAQEIIGDMGLSSRVAFGYCTYRFDGALKFIAFPNMGDALMFKLRMPS